MQVAVPPGVRSGQQIQVCTPTGLHMVLSVPQGVSEGQLFLVEYPMEEAPPVTVSAVAVDSPAMASASAIPAQRQPQAMVNYPQRHAMSAFDVEAPPGSPM